MSEEEGAMWTGNSWKRRRRRDAMKDVRQLFGLTHAHQYLKSYNQMRRHLRLTIGYLIKKNVQQQNSNFSCFFFCLFFSK